MEWRALPWRKGRTGKVTHIHPQIIYPSSFESATCNQSRRYNRGHMVTLEPITDLDVGAG